MEIEVKLKVQDSKDIKQRLENKGVKFSEPAKQVDYYFKQKGKEMEPQCKGSFLIRTRDSGGRHFLTYKELTGFTGEWIEYETGVESIEEMNKILRAIGYTNLLTMTKIRHSGKYEGLTICLDDINELGEYVEIEAIDDDPAAAKERIMQFINSLNLKNVTIEQRGYPQIIFERMGIRYDESLR